MHRTNPLRASAAKGSSARWLARAQQDPYAASKTGGQFVSRAASKLQHMDDKYSLLPKRKPVFGVVDLGAAPGSWTQYVHSKLFNKNTNSHNNSTLIAVDLLPLSPTVTAATQPHLRYIQGDFTQPDTQCAVQHALEHQHAHLILSDMLHNTTGNTDRDAALSYDLYASVYHFAVTHLAPHGSLVMKYYNSALAQDFVQHVLKPNFHHLARCKPPSSRSESKEAFFVCRGFKGSGVAR